VGKLIPVTDSIVCKLLLKQPLISKNTGLYTQAKFTIGKTSFCAKRFSRSLKIQLPLKSLRDPVFYKKEKKSENNSHSNESGCSGCSWPCFSSSSFTSFLAPSGLVSSFLVSSFFGSVFVPLRISRSSTSKTKVDFAGMISPNPRSPYAKIKKRKIC